MNAKEYLGKLLVLFDQHADEGNAVPMKKYMREQFDYYGVKAPLRKSLVKEFVKKHGRLAGDELKMFSRLAFRENHREIQYALGDLIIPIAKKLDPSFLPLFKELIQTKSWWDTVDFIAPHFVGKILLNYPDLIANYPEKWIESDNIWLQRSAILYQLHYKEKIDAERLFRYILRRADSKEFFVQKAAGWTLRQYSKFNAKEVIHFINSHDLASLTKKEGLKWLERRNKK